MEEGKGGSGKGGGGDVWGEGGGEKGRMGRGAEAEGRVRVSGWVG